MATCIVSQANKITLKGSVDIVCEFFSKLTIHLTFDISFHLSFKTMQSTAFFISVDSIHQTE